MPLNQLSLPLMPFLRFLLLDAKVGLVSDQVQMILGPGFQLLKSHAAFPLLWVQFLRMAT